MLFEHYVLNNVPNKLFISSTEYKVECTTPNNISIEHMLESTDYDITTGYIDVTTQRMYITTKHIDVTTQYIV